MAKYVSLPSLRKQSTSDWYHECQAERESCYSMTQHYRSDKLLFKIMLVTIHLLYAIFNHHGNQCDYHKVYK